MTNYDTQLKEFVFQHPEYAAELDSGSLDMNVYCDILRTKPKVEIIAESNLPHDLMLIGNQLATSWMITDPEAASKDYIAEQMQQDAAELLAEAQMQTASLTR